MQVNGAKKPFLLRIYLLVVIAISWPFQFMYLWLGESFRPLLLVSMLAVGAGSYVCGRYIFRDGFTDAGWGKGKFRQYLYVIALALFLWAFPVVLEWFIGIREIEAGLDAVTLLHTFTFSFAVTLLPAFGEEFSWRGYLLPRLQRHYSVRKSLLIHGFITWFWHLPFLLGMSMALDGSPVVTIPAVLLISLIPTIMHAVVFAWIWQSSGSLMVVTVYHAAFDEIRDTLQGTVGFGWFSEYWQALVLTLLGIFLLARKRFFVQVPNTGNMAGQ